MLYLKMNHKLNFLPFSWCAAQASNFTFLRFLTTVCSDAVGYSCSLLSLNKSDKSSPSLQLWLFVSPTVEKTSFPSPSSDGLSCWMLFSNAMASLSLSIYFKKEYALQLSQLKAVASGKSTEQSTKCKPPIHSDFQSYMWWTKLQQKICI